MAEEDTLPQDLRGDHYGRTSAGGAFCLTRKSQRAGCVSDPDDTGEGFSSVGPRQMKGSINNFLRMSGESWPWVSTEGPGTLSLAGTIGFQAISDRMSCPAL